MALVALSGTIPGQGTASGALSVASGAFLDSCGYGDEASGDGGYGDDEFGYGSPCAVIAGFVPGDNRIHDLGGQKVIVRGLAGTFDQGGFTVEVNGVEAYSGVRGQGNKVFPDEAGGEFSFAAPNLFGVTGPVDVEITGSFGSLTFEGILVVERYSHLTSTVFGKIRFPRRRGPYALPLAKPRGL